MKPPLFFLFLLLALIPLASANSIERKIEVTDIYFNNVSVNKEYQVTLVPTPYNEFDYPGYVITEYLPRGFSFISTNAEKYTLTDNKLQLLKLLPPKDNFSLIYKVQYKKDFDPTPSFFGTYLDENRNYGTVNVNTQSQVSSGNIVRDSLPLTSYQKNIDTQTNISPVSGGTYLTSEFIPIPSSPVSVIPISENSNIDTSILLIFFIIIITGFLILRTSHYHKSFNINTLADGNVIVDKKPIGITKEIRFDLDTRISLSSKIKGDILKILVSIKEIPDDKRCFVVTLNPDGKEHSGTIIFSKKRTKIVKYKIKKQ